MRPMPFHEVRTEIVKVKLAARCDLQVDETSNVCMLVASVCARRFVVADENNEKYFVVMIVPMHVLRNFK